MANEIDLQTALSMFVQGARDLSISRALTQAQEQVQQIKMSGIKETDQRMALGQVAQGLVAQMTAAGANASQVANAAAAYMPRQYATAEAALLDANLTGNQGLAAAAGSAIEQSQARELRSLAAREEISIRADARRFEQQQNLLDARLAAQERIAQAKENNRKPTAEEFKVAGFAKRMSDAEKVFNELGKKGFEASDVWGSTYDKLTPNVWRFKDRQKFDQAKRNFINAVLRRESGAAISNSEFENGSIQYFPQPGDSKEVLDQKAANRKAALSAFATEGAQALGKMGTDVNAILNNISTPAAAKTGVNKYLK